MYFSFISLSLTFLATRLITTSCTLQPEEMSKESLVYTTENQVLEGHIIRSQRTANAFSCTHLCLKEANCASLNYEMNAATKGLCQLSDVTCTAGGFGNACTAKTGWIYGEMVRLSDEEKLEKSDKEFHFALTPLGAVGRDGPTDTSGYQGTTLEHMVTLDKGIQIWKAPLNGSYVIEAWGASGADGRLETDESSGTRKGGLGAYMKGTFNLTYGTLLKILVGQKGSMGNLGSPLPGGGGGGTFVTLSSNIPLIVAGGGGGGGAPTKDYEVGDPGQSSEAGSQHGGSNGTGGVILEEGFPSSSFEAGAGGGLNTNGESAVLASGGKSFKEGGQGGNSMSGAKGGFGGGGGGQQFPGAGGGYSGGGVFKAKLSGITVAGGGGSYNGGVNLVRKEGENYGDGRVNITLIN